MSEDIQKQIRSLRNEDQSGRTTYDYRKQCNRAADSLKSLLAEVKSVTRQARTMTEALTKIAGGSYDNLAGDPSLWASSIAGKGLSDAVSGREQYFVSKDQGFWWVTDRLTGNNHAQTDSKERADEICRELNAADDSRHDPSCQIRTYQLHGMPTSGLKCTCHLATDDSREK